MDMTMGQFLKVLSEEKNKVVQNIKKTIFNINIDVRLQTIRNIDQRLNKSGISKGALRNSVSVEIEDGMPITTVGGSAVPYAAAHEYGATIIPKNVSWLTLPNGIQNYGKKASEFNNLYFKLINPQLAALVDKNTNQVIFWLKKYVKIKKKAYLTDAGDTVMNRNKQKLEETFGKGQIWEIE